MLIERFLLQEKLVEVQKSQRKKKSIDDITYIQGIKIIVKDDMSNK